MLARQSVPVVHQFSVHPNRLVDDLGNGEEHLRPHNGTHARLQTAICLDLLLFQNPFSQLLFPHWEEDSQEFRVADLEWTGCLELISKQLVPVTILARQELIVLLRIVDFEEFLQSGNV